MDFTDFTDWDEEEVVKIIRMTDEEFRNRQERESFIFALRKIPLNEVSFFLSRHGFNDVETARFQDWLCRLVTVVASHEKTIESVDDGDKSFDGYEDDYLETKSPPVLSLVPIDVRD